MGEAWKIPALLLIIGLLAGVLTVKSCRPEAEAPKIPIETQVTIDSLRRTAEAFRRMADSSQRIIVYDTIRSVVIEKVAIATTKAGEKLGARADSIAAVARDSSALWESAYRVRTMEADTLRLAVSQLDTALAFERAARRTLGQVYGADTLRRVAIEHVNADLQDAINHLQQPCKVIGPIPCPSRSVTMVLSLVAGAAVGYIAPRR